MSATPHDPELTVLQKSLQGLVPRGAALDRDRLMFRAGQAAARRRFWIWPGLASVAMVACVVLAALWSLRSELPAKERIVYIVVPASDSVSPAVVVAPQPPRPAPELSDYEQHVPERTEYRALRDQVVRMGVEALPQPGPDKTLGHFMKPLSRGSLRDELSNVP
jgi:hypothetical protein